jgi:putative alpha-1,2-mannosidase
MCACADDFGTMSAWAAWAYLGLYPLTGSPTYVLGSPVFADVNITLPGVNGGAALVRVLAHNASAGSVYVSAAAVNGQPLPSPYVNHSALVGDGSGGLLEVWMSDTPGGMWG